jgi:hypothetical protein
MAEAEKRGRDAAISGFAHEHIAAGILMKRYGNVSLVDLPLSPYDIVIVYKTKGGEDIVRAQVKTAQSSISFTGGSRGGVDRTYKSDVKTYTQSTETCDVVIGVHPHNDSYDLFFVPTILIEKLGQSSVSLNKIESLKNNYKMLDNCKDSKFVISNAKKYGIIS